MIGKRINEIGIDGTMADLTIHTDFADNVSYVDHRDNCSNPHNCKYNPPDSQNAIGEYSCGKPECREWQNDLSQDTHKKRKERAFKTTKDGISNKQ